MAFWDKLRQTWKAATGSQPRPTTLAQDVALSMQGDPGAQLGPGAVPNTQPLGGDPRQYQYRPGWNIPGPSGEGRPIDASTLRLLADSYDLLRRCIEIRKNEIIALEWDIIPKERTKKKSQALREQHAAKIAEIKAFFEFPEAYMTKEKGSWDRKGLKSFPSWLNALLEDHLVGDWMTIYPRRKMNGELLALERIDGSTIKPILGLDGRVPLPPNPAYTQWLHGRAAAQFTIEELIYAPRNVRNNSPYGFSPVEQVLVHINEALRYQMWTSAYFTDGSLPEGFFTAPEGWAVDQIREFNDYINAEMAGNQKALRQFHLIPYGSTYLSVKPFAFDDLFARYLIEKTCGLMDVQPIEVGFSPKAGLGGAGFSEGQKEVGQRKSLRPTAKWLANILNDVIRHFFGVAELEFAWTALQDEDDAAHVETDKNRLFSGQATLDQLLMERGDEPVGMNTPIVVTGNQVLFLPDLLKGQEQGASALNPFSGLFPPGSGGPSRPGDRTSEEETGGPLDGPGNEPGEEDDLPGKPAGEDPGEEDGQKSARDIARWKRMAVKAAKAGKRPRPFVSEAIPGPVRAIIKKRLEKAATPASVKAAFLLPGFASQDPQALDQAQEAIREKWARFFEAEAKRFADYIIGNLFPAQKSAKPDVSKGPPPPPPPDLARLLEDYDWGSWVTGLFNPTKKQLQRIYVQGGLDALASIDVNVGFGLRNPRAEAYATARAAELVGMRIGKDGDLVPNPRDEYAITTKTRDMLRGTIGKALEEGLSMEDLRDTISDDYAFSDTRAMAIARTETGTAYNRGAITGYKESGVVEEVDVVDGDDDEECAAANGQRWTLEQAEQNPLAHPNCRRTFIPVVKEGD